MTSSNKIESKNAVAQRQLRVEGLTKALRKSSTLRMGLVALLTLGFVGGTDVAFSQSARAASTSPWVTANGKEAIDLNAKSASRKNVVKRVNNPIRQTQALTPQGASDSILDPAFDPEPSLNETLDDAMQVADPVFNASNSDVAPTVASPLDADDDASDAVAPMPSVPPTKLQATQAPQAQSNPVQNYPMSEPKQTVPAAPRAAAPSHNPYARIGQAEYHPNQFYSTNPNYSVNGYRNTPPAVAYGQSLCGDACYDGACNGGCGFFGGFFQNSTAEAGLVGMRSPLDMENSGNFGGDFALNWGSVQPVFAGLYAQAGARGVFTNFNGIDANGFEDDNCRSQVFWTAGLYYRTNECSDGWNVGVVYDSVTNRDYRKYNLSQVRAELSYTFNGTGTIGFRGAFALNDDWCDFLNMDGISAQVKSTGTDYYTMFYRKQFDQGGNAAIFAGVTEWSEALLGFSAEAPLSDSLAVKCGGSYVFAKDRSKDGGLSLTKRQEESWNLSLGIAWHLGGGASSCMGTQRPLFDVADNGTFLQNFIRK